MCCHCWSYLLPGLILSTFDLHPLCSTQKLCPTPPPVLPNASSPAPAHAGTGSGIGRLHMLCKHSQLSNWNQHYSISVILKHQCRRPSLTLCKFRIGLSVCNKEIKIPIFLISINVRDANLSYLRLKVSEYKHSIFAIEKPSRPKEIAQNLCVKESFYFRKTNFLDQILQLIEITSNYFSFHFWTIYEKVNPTDFSGTFSDAHA